MFSFMVDPRDFVVVVVLLYFLRKEKNEAKTRTSNVSEKTLPVIRTRRG